MSPATAPTSRPFVPHLARLGIAALGMALFAAAMWFAWLGWDHEYYQVDGVAQGPYRPWQVIGCGVSVAAAAVAAQLWVRGVWSVFVLAVAATIGFAVPWTADAAASDDSGLFVIGLLFLLIGGTTGLVVVLAITHAVDVRRPGHGRAS
jgi:peptidoglycan/LPS O-acetylase OafA/YrhL